MAQALHDLARDWIVDLLTPFMLPRANRSPEDKETWRRLQEMVHYRDGRCSMCCRSSCQGRKARCVTYAYYFRTDKACTAAIFRRSIMEDDEPSTIGRRAYGTLRRYCNLSETSLDVYSQQNTLFLHDPALWSFRNFLWCLKATAIPNKYDVISLRPAGGKLDDRHWYVESTRWKTPAETAKAWKSDGRAYDIPNPALLRVHAMVATVLARSGSRDLIVNPYDFVPTGLDGRVDNTMGPIAFHEGRDVDDLYAFEQTQQLPLWSQAAKLPGRVLRTCAPCVKHWLVRNAPWSANGASGVEDTDPPPAYSSRRASKEILPAYGEVHRV
ncbi:hypothetical protein K466DRAFT_667507 [Polyporus arcularius HHB13444]|uniref:HNH nuclease domain-containing protein n=1 Tax=Polyporus arcularius HHB13444 TaxID=1314778 RepID=A0A5C3NTD3_9APHY|nr:hypothetical protein K466DRAFT_667507 [Polyporus arcularius HHB13444]